MSEHALIVCGGWEGHEPRQCSAIIEGVLTESGFEVRVENTFDAYLETEKLRSLSLIVPVWTMGSIEDRQLKGLLEAVKGGVGIDAFRQSTAYQWMVGGQWVAHPDNITDYEVNIVKEDDPITRRGAPGKAETKIRTSRNAIRNRRSRFLAGLLP